MISIEYRFDFVFHREKPHFRDFQQEVGPAVGWSIHSNTSAHRFFESQCYEYMAAKFYDDILKSIFPPKKSCLGNKP